MLFNVYQNIDFDTLLRGGKSQRPFYKHHVHYGALLTSEIEGCECCKFIKENIIHAISVRGLASARGDFSNFGNYDFESIEREAREGE